MEFGFAAKSFGPVHVLRPCQFSLREGEVTALLGPSGVGKTTLLRLIAGLDTDDSGQRSHGHRVGMVFQEPRLMPWLTVRQNIELVAPEAGWLQRLGLAGTEDMYPRQLSLGMARRVALARALAFKPDVLVLDEPFASLDTATAQTVRTVLNDLLSRERVTTLLVTHDETDAVEFAARVLRLSGRPATLEAGQ